MVPMNLRSNEEGDRLGNRVGIFTVTLPVGEPRADRRLEAIAEQTRAAKRDQRGAAFPALLQVLPLLPAPALAWLSKNSLGKVNLVCTNVPGLPERRYMAGAEIEAIYPFASPVEKTPMILALMSYAGCMHFGIDTDPEAIPDPHRLMVILQDELDALERLAGVEA
jgi:hypothetical protein